MAVAPPPPSPRTMRRMLKLMRSLGFEIKAYPEDPDFRLVTHAL